MEGLAQAFYAHAQGGDVGSGVFVHAVALFYCGLLLVLQHVVLIFGDIDSSLNYLSLP